MLDVPILYATTEGHTRRIAEHMAGTLRAHGLDSQAIEVTSPEAEAIDWPAVRGVALAASLHVGAHQPAAVEFVRRHLAELSLRPSIFFSFSLSICSSRPEEVAAARRIAQALPDELGWTPMRIACVGGRLAYTKYGFLTRWMMRRIAAREGGPTDTSRDHDLTDWKQVEALAEELALVSVPVRARRAAR